MKAMVPIFLGAILLFSAVTSVANDDAMRIEALIDDEYAARNEGTVLEGGTRVRRNSAASAPSSAEPVMDEPAITVSTDILYDDLPNFIGQNLVVTTTGQKKYRGRIESFGRDKLTMTIRKHGGEAIMPLQRNNILKIERY